MSDNNNITQQYAKLQEWHFKLRSRDVKIN